MPITASELRRNVYQLLDSVLETGTPLEIERHGRTLRVVADPAPRKLDRLVPHPGSVTGDPADLVDIGWEHEWRP